VTHLLVNEHEAAALLGADAAAVIADPVAAARRLTAVAPVAVVTLGAAGAAWAERGGGEGRQPAFAVEVVDTTAAGDAFAGALAARLAAGARDLAAAGRYACAAGARATTRAGAQPSLPTGGEVEALLAGACATGPGAPRPAPRCAGRARSCPRRPPRPCRRTGACSPGRGPARARPPRR